MRESSNLKVSVWSPFAPRRDMILAVPTEDPGDAGTSSPKQLSDDNPGGLHKEIFGWRMHEDLFGGIVSEDDRQAIRVALFETMGMSVPPEKRTIEALKAFVEKADVIIAKGGVEWTGSQSSTSEAERRVNPLVALVNHMRWLIDVFFEHPNISITIR